MIFNGNLGVFGARGKIAKKYGTLYDFAFVKYFLLP